jgi:hypothetical protein
VTVAVAVPGVSEQFVAVSVRVTTVPAATPAAE